MWGLAFSYGDLANHFNGCIGVSLVFSAQTRPRAPLNSLAGPCPLFMYNRLVDDVLGKDTGDKVPMEKVVMLIWQFRDDPTVVTFMARFVAKVRPHCVFWFMLRLPPCQPMGSRLGFSVSQCAKISFG